MKKEKAEIVEAEVVEETSEHQKRFDMVETQDLDRQLANQTVFTPMTMIENCRELLKPGGLLLLQTPNTRSLRSRVKGAKWDMLDPDQHLNLFSPDALHVLLTTVGFEVLEMTTASGTGLERGAVSWSARVKESLLGLLNLGSAMVVVARRPL